MQADLTATASQYKAAVAANVPLFIATVKTVTATMSEERAAATAFGANGCAPPGRNGQGGPGGSGIPFQAMVQLAACMRANGVAVRANTPPNNPPLITRVPAASRRYQAVGAKCRGQLGSRFPGLAHSPVPP